MGYYYIIVSTVATIILVLILTYVGILMTSTQKKALYPPSYSLCPDYWQTNEAGKCLIPQGSTATNTVSATTLRADYDRVTTGKKPTPGLDISTPPSYIDFADTNWSANGTVDQRCGWKAWANKYNVQWDGVSNYNGC
jgi:hypothetical protein